MSIEVYTDGSCLGNPGPGGWACVFVKNKEIVLDISGSELSTTNNRMELLAYINAVRALPPSSIAVVYTDSKYVCDGISSWIKNWRINGWKSSSGNPVANQDLWMRADSLIKSKPLVHCEWVKGHAGNRWNEYANDLAIEEAKLLKESIV